MHNYTSMRYCELRGDVITVSEIDRDGLPTREVMQTQAIEADDLAGELYQAFHLIVDGLPPYSCECGSNFMAWLDAQLHLQLYCLHIDITEWTDSSMKCLDCGLEIESDPLGD